MIMRFKTILFLSITIIFLSCSSSGRKNKSEVQSSPPLIAFLDAFEDPTISKAKIGFLDALEKNGFSQSNRTLQFIYKNAEGSPGTMNLAISYILSRHPDLIASSTTLSTLAVCQRSKNVPVFMIVSPNPILDGLSSPGKPPQSNLSGVYEDLDYIDTAIALIPAVLHSAKKVAAIYSQSESQSASAFDRLKTTCKKLHLELDALPVNNSSDTRLVVRRLMNGHPDAFFALPDNSVFASFESINLVCQSAKVPIFTSEEGLVDRGAIAAFGADIYQWGFQAGKQAAIFLKNGKNEIPPPERVFTRHRIYNDSIARHLGLVFPGNFKPTHLMELQGSVHPFKSDDKKLNKEHTLKPGEGRPLNDGSKITGKEKLFKTGSLNSVHIKLNQSRDEGKMTEMGFNLWTDAILTGLCLSFLAFGIYLSLRIFQIPDITTDGSFTLGAVITGLCLARHINPWLALPLAFLGGAIAGSITGLISTRFKINALLAGILVMTGMYSVNIWLLGRANITIDSNSTFFIYSFTNNIGAFSHLLLLALVVLSALVLLFWFLKTDFGISMRASGSSPVMARSVGIETNRMQVTGLALANGFTGIAGYLVAQFQGFVDIGMGTGIVITGLGSVLIGDSLARFLNIQSIGLQLISLVCGSILFQILIAIALSIGVDPIWIRLITSLLVLLVVIIPQLIKKQHGQSA